MAQHAAPSTAAPAPHRRPSRTRVAKVLQDRRRGRRADDAAHSGLLLYFGRQHATALFDLLRRTRCTVFELSPQDYLVRSADGLFVPLALGAANER